MIVINGTVTDELKQHLIAGGTHPIAKRYANLIVAGGNAVGGSVLPKGYAAVEYVQSNNDISFCIGGTWCGKRNVFDMQFLDVTNDQFMGYSGQAGGYFGIYRGSFNVKLSDSDSINENPLNRNVIEVTSDGTTCTMSIKGKTISRDVASRSGEEWIFSIGGEYYAFCARLWSKKSYSLSSGELIQNLVPAIRESDGITGLYDTVGQMFYEPIAITSTASEDGLEILEINEGLI